MDGPVKHRVLISDRNKLVGDCIEALLWDAPGYEFVGATVDHGEIERLFQSDRPTVWIIGCGEGSDFEWRACFERLSKKSGELKTVFLLDAHAMGTGAFIDSKTVFSFDYKSTSLEKILEVIGRSDTIVLAD